MFAPQVKIMLAMLYGGDTGSMWSWLYFEKLLGSMIVSVCLCVVHMNIHRDQ